ncbi:MAG TPA: hypothetical protein VNQ81_11540 [Povalibacter sp.]|nr:hypothetical protein [Povalibacter sp.]
MSVATHSGPQTHSGTAAGQPAMRPVYAFVSSDIEEEFRLHLADIPRYQDTLDVEGLKPTLLSRLLDLVMPHGRR